MMKLIELIAKSEPKNEFDHKFQREVEPLIMQWYQTNLAGRFCLCFLFGGFMINTLVCKIFGIKRDEK